MKRQKKDDVLILCQYFYPEYISSATLPYDTAVALTKSGLKVSVLCGYPKEYSLKDKVPINEVKDGINIKRVRYLHLDRKKTLGRLINFLSFTIAIIFKFFYFRKFKTIIVYSNPPILPIIPAIAKKLFKNKLIFVSYDIYPEIAHRTNTLSKKHPISLLMRIINRILFNNVDRVVSLSNEMKRYISENRHIDSNKIIVIPNWFEDNYNEEKTNVKNNLFNSINSTENLIVSYFGNMGTAQDMDTIINTIINLREEQNIKFLFAGHGNKMETLRNIVKCESLTNVMVFNFLHGQDFQDALTISDCFIVSLEKGLEGLAVPSKTYSYMMAGKPIIAIMDKETDIAKDLIENYAGFVIENDDIETFSQSLIKLKSDKYLVKLMGNNCRKVFLQKYEKDTCTTKYVKLVHQLLEVED